MVLVADKLCEADDLAIVKLWVLGVVLARDVSVSVLSGRIFSLPFDSGKSTEGSGDGDGHSDNDAMVCCLNKEGGERRVTKTDERLFTLNTLWRTMMSL